MRHGTSPAFPSGDTERQPEASSLRRLGSAQPLCTVHEVDGSRRPPARRALEAVGAMSQPWGSCPDLDRKAQR